MNIKDFLCLGVPLGKAARRATDFIAQFILGGGDKSLHYAIDSQQVRTPSQSKYP